MIVAASGFFPGSIGNLVMLSGSKSWNRIRLVDPAPLACLGSARSLDPFAFHVLKQHLIGLDITPRS